VIPKRQGRTDKTVLITGCGIYNCVRGCHMGQPRNIPGLGQPCRHLSKIYGTDYSRQQYLQAQERLLVSEIGSEACHPLFARELFIQLLCMYKKGLPEVRTSYPTRSS
jgi:hypothetical protein